MSAWVFPRRSAPGRHVSLSGIMRLWLGWRHARKLEQPTTYSCKGALNKPGACMLRVLFVICPLPTGGITHGRLRSLHRERACSPYERERGPFYAEGGDR